MIKPGSVAHHDFLFYASVNLLYCPKLQEIFSIPCYV